MKINMKTLITVLFFFFTQNVNANWITIYQGEIFTSKLLLSSVKQENQKTNALFAIIYKEKFFSDGVGSHVLLVEHVCGEINPTIVEEKFFEGAVNKSKELIGIENPGKLKKYVDKSYPRLIKQICI